MFHFALTKITLRLCVQKLSPTVCGTNANFMKVKNSIITLVQHCNIMPECVIRRELGDNPDISKALRYVCYNLFSLLPSFQDY